MSDTNSGPEQVNHQEPDNEGLHVQDENAKTLIQDQDNVASTVTPGSNPEPINLEQKIAEAKRLLSEENEERLRRKIQDAQARGKEEFNADKLFELYYPNDWSNDEADVLRRAQSYMKDYYNSDVQTIQEWVNSKESIERQGDS